MNDNYNRLKKRISDIQGLEVTEISNDEASCLITYDDTFMDPVCPYDDTRLTPRPFLKPRVVTDLLDMRSGQTVEVLYRQRRYRCPTCGRDMSCESPYIRQGSKITRALEDYIGDAALYDTYDAVANRVRCVSKVQVKRIFEDWSKKQINDYMIDLMAPKHLGVHIVGNSTNQYLLLSDLSKNHLLDIMPLSASSMLLTLLLRFAAQEITRGVCTEIDSESLAPVRSVYEASPDVDVSVARASVYKAYAAAVHDAVATHYSKKEKKKLLLRMILTPLTEGLIQKDVDEMKRLADQEPMMDMGRWIEHLITIRQMVQDDKWDKVGYQSWKYSIASIREREIEDLVRYLTFADPEIQCGLKSPDLQKKHERITERANYFITLNSHCSFDILRARVLLTINPTWSERVVGYQTVKACAGIDMDSLIDRMEQILLGGILDYD